MKMKSSSSSLSLGSKSHTFGCISLILQRILCSGTSSTYPSDQITEPGFESPDFVSEPPRARGDEPGAVARLMGLDSIPVIDKTRVVSRSRSVDNNDETQGKHRRVKSTLDSQKLLKYVELEDENFFILSFEKDQNDNSFGELKQLGTRKCKKRRETREHQSETENQTRIEDKENDINAMNVSPGELKQRRKEKRKNRRKRREIKLRQNITENIEKENGIKSYGRWSRDGYLANCEVRSVKEVEECRSCDDWSPVSVLDYDRFTAVGVTPEPENNSRRRLSSELEPSKGNETIQEDHIPLTKRSRESENRLHGYQEMWHMICRLTVSDLERSNWVNIKASKPGDLEGIISEDIVSSILDQLLEETITKLSLTSQV